MTPPESGRRRARPRRAISRGWPAAPLALVAAAVTLGAPSSSFARDRIAVLILPFSDGDRALADNLTEVAIAALAETTDADLVGTRELRRRLALTGGADLPSDCVNQVACLARVGVMVGVQRLLSGSVRPEGDRYLIALAINDIEAGKVERSFFRAVDGGLDSLIRNVQEGVSELFGRRSVAGQLRVDSIPEGATVVVDDENRGTTPLWLNPVSPGRHRLRLEMRGRFPWKKDVEVESGRSLLVSVGRDELGPRRTWAPYAAYGTAVAAALSFAAAGLFGTLARTDPRGASRGEAQANLHVMNDYATVANVLLVVGGVLSGVSVATFVGLRRDLAGE